MISQYALNTNGVGLSTSFRKSRPESLPSLIERSLGGASIAKSFLTSNEQLLLEHQQQQALAKLEHARLLSLQDQMKDAINISSHSQLGVATSLRSAASEPIVSRRSGQKRSADELLGPSPSSDDTLLLHKQEQLQNVLRKNHREIMANAALGLIANAKSNKTQRTSPQLSPVTSELAAKSRLDHLLLLQRQSSPVNTMEPSIQGNYAPGYELRNALPYLNEDEKLVMLLKIQQENEIKQEMLQNYAQRDLFGSIQMETLTQSDRLLLLLKKKQDEEQNQMIQENLRHEQLYSLVKQRQLEEQQRELKLRMATMEKIQRVQSEARRERSGTY